jgi:hypothetical protein
VAVAFDAKSSAVTAAAAAASPLDHNNMTVGTGGSNYALIAYVMVQAGTLPPNLAATWNGVSMTAITGASLNGGVALFGLVAPASGNKTLEITWTGGGTFNTYVYATSWTGVDQTGGATSFPNGNNSTGSVSPHSVTITSATGNMVTAGHLDNDTNWGAISGITLFTSVALADNAAANYDNGAASVTLTAAYTSGSAWWTVGTDIKAAGGGGGGSPLKRYSDLNGLGGSGPFFHDPLASLPRHIEELRV